MTLTEARHVPLPLSGLSRGWAVSGKGGAGLAVTSRAKPPRQPETPAVGVRSAPCLLSGPRHPDRGRADSNPVGLLCLYICMYFEFSFISRNRNKQTCMCARNLSIFSESWGAVGLGPKAKQR